MLETSEIESFDSLKGTILMGLCSSFDNKETLVSGFNKKNYEPMFREVERQQEENFQIIEKIYSQDTSGTLLSEIAQSFVNIIAGQVEQAPSKRKKEAYFTDYNFVLAVYLIPAMVEKETEAGEAMAEAILKHWKKAFPKAQTKISTFEKINGGFKQKYCFITTAVCEYLGKPDDCYELTTFREFRDGYLMNTPGGKELVQEYYNIAPTIVKKIQRQQDKEQCYHEILNQYLQPCLTLIEEGENQKCKDYYIEMVQELKKKYH